LRGQRDLAPPLEGSLPLGVALLGKTDGVWSGDQFHPVARHCSGFDS
jgi:hypothetical protein